MLIRRDEMFALACVAMVNSAVNPSGRIQAPKNRIAQVLKGRRTARAKAVALAP
jgi:hypothetical protein